MTTLDTQTQWDNETYQQFRRTVVLKRQAAEAAREQEAAARSEYTKARQVRIKAEAELFAEIDRFSVPMPLFDLAAKNGATPDPEPKRPWPVEAPLSAPKPAGPLTRDTSLADLVPEGPDKWRYVACMRQARLYSVGDLVDQAASTPKKVSNATDWVDGTATVYEVLGTLIDLPRATILAIGDAVIDAGPLPPPEPPPAKPKRKRATEASVQAVEPVQVPANLFPDTLPENTPAGPICGGCGWPERPPIPEGQGEPLPAGVTVEALMAAYIAHRFANRKKGGPPTVKPVEFDGKLWVVVSYAGDATKEYGFNCLPLVPTITWLDNHPSIPLKDKPRSGMDTHEDYLQFWTGVKVKVGKREHAIDVAGEARTIVTPIAAAEVPQSKYDQVAPCHRCTKVGQPIAGKPASEATGDDLLPLDDLDVAIADHLEVRVDDCPGKYLCLECVGKVVREIEGKATVEPAADQSACHRCGTPGEVCDEPALASEETDLISFRWLTIDVLPALGLSAEEATAKHICCKCKDDLAAQGIGGSNPKKRKGGKG